MEVINTLQTNKKSQPFSLKKKMTSIDLKSLKVVTKVSATTNAGEGELASLEKSRIEWEGKELAASNARLYKILKRSYGFYIQLKTDSDKELRNARRQELDRFISERKYEFGTTSHDMTRVVKCVFGIDRRRVSAYSIALREALRQDISVDDLISFIENEGGVEQIRLGGTKALAPTVRANLVKEEVFNNNIGDIKIDAKLINVNADWNDKHVVIIATYRPTGFFEANAVVKHDGAVTAALAAYNNIKKAKFREAEREVKKTNELTEKVSSSIQRKMKSQALRNVSPAQKDEKRKAKTKAAIEKSKLIETSTEQFNNLFISA
jgi:hypothetical protein